MLRPTNSLVSLLRTTASMGVVAGLLVACGSAPSVPDRASARPDAATSSAPASTAKSGSQKSGAAAEVGASSAATGTANPSAQTEIPRRALADFDRAVGLMRSGNAGEAELEFKTLVAGYPQLTGAHINLALLQRKANHLDEAEATLKSAVEKNPNSASAWNELGLTQRMRGEFHDAAASYEQSLAADPNFAPAHRNYAVLLDLYLGDPEHALTELERYKELTHEEKPITGWIAELRQRTGKPAAPKPAAAPAPTEQSEGAAPASSETPPAKPPTETPQPRTGGTTARAVISLQALAGTGA